MATIQNSDHVIEWKRAGEAGDARAAVGCLSEDIELISPLTARYTFVGRDQLLDVMTSAFGVITSIEYHTDIGEGPDRSLFYRGQVAGMEVEEAQLLRLDNEGRIRELTLFGRPLPALAAVMAGIGPKLLRRQGHGRLAPVAGAAIAPLAVLTRLGEKYLAPLADPNRTSEPHSAEWRRSTGE
jgi:hypothetical protein